MTHSGRIGLLSFQRKEEKTGKGKKEEETEKRREGKEKEEKGIKEEVNIGKAENERIMKKFEIRRNIGLQHFPVTMFTILNGSQLAKLKKKYSSHTTAMKFIG